MQEMPEQIVDEYYAKLNTQIIIPLQKDAVNTLTQATNCLYRYIDTFETLQSDLATEKTAENLLVPLLEKIDAILISVQGINYSSFCQYFMIQNISHSIYSSFSKEMRLQNLKQLICEYIKDRHHLYKMHGYTPVTLQTMCDSYSHKRKGKAGIYKIEAQLKKLNIVKRIKKIEEDSSFDLYYFLPDKGDKALFEVFLRKYNINFKFRELKQGKLPDVVVKIRNKIYIIEHKSMKESGGGQDKQISEIFDFIRYTEDNTSCHYITYLDGIYSNKFLGHSSAKNEIQYTEIKNILKTNPRNYFVNTYTFFRLMQEVLDYEKKAI